MFEVEKESVLKGMDPLSIYELSDGSKLKMGAFNVFVPEFLTNSSYGQKYSNGNYIFGGGYGEVAFTETAVNALTIPWNLEDLNGRGEIRKDVYLELTKKWGLNIKLKESTKTDINWNPLPLEKNEEYANINVFNDTEYRKLVERAINIWNSSYSHKNTMLYRYNRGTGFAWVGGYCYAGFYS
jgi:hypothetical protein